MLKWCLADLSVGSPFSDPPLGDGDIFVSLLHAMRSVCFTCTVHMLRLLSRGPNPRTVACHDLTMHFKSPKSRGSGPVCTHADIFVCLCLVHAARSVYGRCTAHMLCLLCLPGDHTNHPHPHSEHLLRFIK